MEKDEKTSKNNENSDKEESETEEDKKSESELEEIIESISKIKESKEISIEDKQFHDILIPTPSQINKIKSPTLKQNEFSQKSKNLEEDLDFNPKNIPNQTKRDEDISQRYSQGYSAKEYNSTISKTTNENRTYDSNIKISILEPNIINNNIERKTEFINPLKQIKNYPKQDSRIEPKIINPEIIKRELTRSLKEERKYKTF